MATEQSAAEYITGQIRDAGAVSFRKMFGEYAVYLDRKVIILI